MATQLAPTPIVKGDSVKKVLQEIENIDFGSTYDKNIQKLKGVVETIKSSKNEIKNRTTF